RSASRRYVGRYDRYLSSSTLTQTDTPRRLLGRTRGAGGAVTTPGGAPQPHVGRYRGRRITRRWARTSTARRVESSVPLTGATGRPQARQQHCPPGIAWSSTTAGGWP